MHSTLAIRRAFFVLPWLAAVLWGALAPALLVAADSQNIHVLPLAFIITLGHAVILGLPLALLCVAKRWHRASVAIVGGFMIGATPAGVYAWPVSSLRTNASVDGIPTIIDGVPTLAGWIEFFKFVSMLGGLGAAGALVFWLIIKWSGLLKFQLGSPLPIARPIGFVSLSASAAVFVSIAVAAIPSITKDRTCHNMFRDGRVSAIPKVNIDLDIRREDWPELTALLQQFSAVHAMSFRNSSESRPGVVEVLALSACNDAGAVIEILDQRWASHDYRPLFPGWGIPIPVYDVGSGNSWQPLAKDLIEALNAHWPGKIRFRDPGGRVITERVTPNAP